MSMSYTDISDLFDAPKPKLYYVKWVDSALVNEQVDAVDLPEPNIIQTVGWLSKETDEYLVISRDDHTQSKNAYEWRGSCAIPRVSILECREVRGMIEQTKTRRAESTVAKPKSESGEQNK